MAFNKPNFIKLTLARRLFVKKSLANSIKKLTSCLGAENLQSRNMHFLEMSILIRSNR